MKLLSSFAVLNLDGSDRVSFTYDVVNEETGEPESKNIKGNFYAVNRELVEHIDWIRRFIRENKLSD